MKATKLVTTILVICAINTFVNAQLFTVGIRGGLNVSNVKYNVVVDTINAQVNVDSYNSFLAGIALNFESKKKFIYGVEVNLMNKGFKNRVTYASSTNQIATSYPEDRNIKAVSIPCSFGKKFGGKVFIGLNVGLAPTFIYKGESDSAYSISGTTNISVATKDIKEDLNTFSLEGFGTIFLGVKLFDRFMIQGDLRYQQAFNDLYKDDEIQDKYFGKTSSISGALVFKYILFKNK